MIQGKNTDCVDVLLNPCTAPSPVVARGWDIQFLVLDFCPHHYCHLHSSCSHDYHVTYSREGVAHWVLSAWHPLLLFRKQVILPHLEKRVSRKTKGTCWLKVKIWILREWWYLDIIDWEEKKVESERSEQIAFWICKGSIKWSESESIKKCWLSRKRQFTLNP